MSLMMNEIIILGVGSATSVFMDWALSSGFSVVGLYHYNSERTGDLIHGYEILGSFDDLFSRDIKGKLFMLSMGDMKIRKTLTDKIKQKGGILPTIVHPTAIVSKFANVSNEGVIIGPYSIIQSDVTICEGVVIWDATLICHTTKINNFVFVGPQNLVGANLIIEPYVFIGQRSLLISGKACCIGEDSLIGAGAVVTKTINKNRKVVGFPAKEIGFNNRNNE